MKSLLIIFAVGASALAACSHTEATPPGSRAAGRGTRSGEPAASSVDSAGSRRVSKAEGPNPGRLETRTATGESSSAGTPCPADPYPCGAEWPVALASPFELAKVTHVQVEARDGVHLDGWIAAPSVPSGVRTPTVLISSPYFDTPPSRQDPKAGGPWWDDTTPMSLDVEGASAGFPPIRLIQSGYSIAYFSVRGTGHSEGCFDDGGLDEQRDQAELINWIAAQPWSNGRVAMVGISYMAWTTWEGAVQAPAALKAIVTAGDLLDAYQFDYTPQGARSVVDEAYDFAYNLDFAEVGGARSDPVPLVNHAPCAFVQFPLSESLSLATGDRNESFWNQRALATRLPAVRAAVLDSSGYYDVGGHQFQDSAVWGGLPATTPKVQFRGWWGHAFPNAYNGWGTELNLPSGATDWQRVVMQWLDYWLKGIGPAPRTEVVYHQDQTLQWHEASSWSAEPAKKEVLYFAGTGLSAAPGRAATSFRSVPPPLDHNFGLHELFATAGAPLADDAGLKFGLCPSSAALPISRLFSTAAATRTTLLAGNPVVDLSLVSDLPGGMIGADLYDVGPGFSCRGPLVKGARYIAAGSADLNFHASPYRSQPFPTGMPTEVRIDLNDVTYSLQKGHRLAVVLSHGEFFEHAGTALFPTLTVGPTSDIVVPVAEGTFGGQHPTKSYPHRPFTPVGYRD